MELREFRRHHGKRSRIWTIRVDGDAIYTTHGWSGGTMQKNKDIPGRSSRETSQERAISRANKLASDKINTGYTEYVPGTDTIIGDEARTAIDFDKAPPDGLELFKPRLMPKPGSSEHKKMMKAIDADDALISKKYNGMKHIVTVSTKGDIRLFTRRMEECSQHYPAIINELELLGLPGKTMLAIELYVRGGNKFKENFILMQSLSRSLPERAVQLQKNNPNIIPYAAVLAPVFWEGEPIVKRMKVMDWMTFLSLKFEGRKPRRPNARVHTVKMFFGSLDDAFAEVKKYGFEGLVVYDGEACFGDKAFNFRGKAERPECWKQKIIYEEDFIAVFDPHHNSDWKEGGSFGSGKNMTKPKSLALYQQDYKGNLVYICNVGTGMSDAMRQLIADSAEEHGYWIGVVEVEYSERKYEKEGDGSNALTFPTFKKLHEDKLPQECVNERL